MPNRYQPDFTTNSVVDQKTGDKITFGDGGSMLAIIATTLYNDMAKCTDCMSYTQEATDGECPSCGGNRLRRII